MTEINVEPPFFRFTEMNDTPEFISFNFLTEMSFKFKISSIYDSSLKG